MNKYTFFFLTGTSDFRILLSLLCFEADEETNLVGINTTFVIINDDSIDEAEEYFILTMQLVDAVAFDRINIKESNLSIVTIIDNDGMHAYNISTFCT